MKRKTRGNPRISASVPPVPSSYPPVPSSYPPVPSSYPPVPSSYPPVPSSYPPVPSSYPPVPSSYPPVPSSYPPAPSVASTLSRSESYDACTFPTRNKNLSEARLSVVVVARNEAQHIRRTLEYLMEGAPAGTEFVVVDDGSDDRTVQAIDNLPGVRVLRASGLGVARARNLGWRESKGEIVVFSDAHVEAPNAWWKPLADALQDQSVGAAAPAIYGIGLDRHLGYGLRIRDLSLGLRWLPKRHSSCYAVPAVNTCFVALRREVLEKTGGFDAGLDTWGHTDLETSLRLWLLGWKVVVVPELEIGHLFRREHPYPVRWRSVLHNALRVAFIHFGQERQVGVIEALRSHPSFPAALAKVAASDFVSRRNDLAQKRLRNDAWYFECFHPDFPCYDGLAHVGR